MDMQQVFLSYCHRDDEPYGPQNRRWVEEFETALRESIGQRLGPGRVQLWRDKRRLAGNELFDAQIEQQLDRSAIFVTVLSQHYLASPYCKLEFQSFGQRRIASGDLHVDTLSRIVKVYRRAIDRADLRRFVDLPALVSEIDRTVGFELFYKDGLGIDRDVLLDPDMAGLYWQRADDIALAIKRMLDASSHAPTASRDGHAAAARTATPIASGMADANVRTSSDTAPRRAVYLARTASDMRDTRDAIQRELEDRGFRVLPEQEFPEALDGLTQAVQADLDRCVLSVHLIGARYGAVPEGTEKSNVELQTDLALAHTARSFRSVFWSPPATARDAVTEARQREFVGALEDAAFAPDRAEFVRASLEQLRTLLVERLREPEPAPTVMAVAPAAEAAVGRGLYLMCDPSDRADAKPLQVALMQLGFDVVRPSMEGTPEELLEENKANLVASDVVVVVWGKSREAWVRSKLREAQQAPGWGRTRPFRGRFVVVAPPDSAAKLDFDVPAGVVVLRGMTATTALEALLR